MKSNSLLGIAIALAMACDPALGPSEPPSDGDGAEAESRTESNASIDSSLEGPFGTVSPATHKMGLIGVQHLGTTTWRCSGVFMQNNWMLTAASCAASVPFGAKLVVTALTPNGTGGFQTVDVLQRSPMGGNRDVMMVRTAAPATGVWLRGLRSTPVGPTDALYCYGFSQTTAGITLGRRLIAPQDPSAASFAVVTGFGESSHPLDTGGVCMVGSDVVGLMQHVDIGRFDVLNLSPSAAQGIRTEILDAPPAYLTSAALGLWPVAYQAASTSRCLQAQPNSTGSWSLFMADCGPLWAQGFLSEIVSSTATTTDARWRHRGTGRCLQFTVNSFFFGLALAPCSTSNSSQRFRTTYMNDGSIRVRNLGWPVCLASTGSQVTVGSCSSTAASQQWYQGFGVM